MTLVTVVIPCHNCEKWIARAVNSVLAQTHQQFNIILVENNSTDSTLQVLEQLEEEHPGVIRVYIETKKGACAARNLGISKATGEWVQLLDADDELLPQKIEKQLALAQSQQADVVIGNYVRYNQTITGETYKVKILADKDPWAGLIKSKLGITSANLWRRESLLKVNGLDEAKPSSQEYDLMFRLLQAGAVFTVSDAFDTIIYKQPESVSKTSDAAKTTRILLGRYNLRIEILNALHEKGLLKHAYKQELYKALYAILMSVSEVDMPLFKEKMREFNFKELGLKNRLRIYQHFIQYNPKRKYSRSNLLLNLTEFNFFALKHIHLLKY